MRRMGAVIGFTSLVALSFAYFLGETAAFCCAFALLLCIAVSFAFKKLRKHKYCISVMITAMVFLCVYISYTELYYKPAVINYSGRELYITATVEEEPYCKYGKYYYFIKTVTVGGEDKNLKIFLKTQNEINADVGDNLAFTGEINQVGNDYYKTKGYYFCINGDDDFSCRVTQPEIKTIKYYPNKFRDKLESTVNAYMNDDTAGICNAMTFGCKYGVDSEVKENFRKTGVSHIIVVSGLHMSIVSMVLLFILSKTLRKKYLYCPLTVFFVLFYMVMTGLSYSVIRSGIMVIIMLIARMIMREADSVNSLGIAALIIVLPNPYSAADTGLLLSFASTLGIVLFSPSLTKYVCKKLNFHNRIISGIIGVVSVAVSAAATVLPIEIIFFRNISLVSVITNLAVTPVVELIIIFVMTGALLGLTGISALSSPFMFVANYIAKYILAVTGIMGNLPFSSLGVGKNYVYIWLLMTGIIAVCIIMMKNYTKTLPVAAAMSAFILICAVVSSYIAGYNSTVLTVYDTGDGITLTVKDRNNTVILSSGGDYYHRDIADRLDNSSDTYSLLSLTDSTIHRSLYSEEILSGFDLDNVLIYDSDIDFENYSDNIKSAVCFKENYSVRIGRMNIDYITAGGKVYVYLECDGNTLLVLPRYADCSVLDEKYSTADIVVSDSAVYNGESIKSNLFILCCSEEGYGRCMLNNSINAHRIYTTFNGDFISEMQVW